VIAFDADDTLWHNERLFIAAQAEFRRILARYQSPDWIDARLNQTEAAQFTAFWLWDQRLCALDDRTASS